MIETINSMFVEDELFTIEDAPDSHINNLRHRKAYLVHKDQAYAVQIGYLPDEQIINSYKRIPISGEEYIRAINLKDETQKSLEKLVFSDMFNIEHSMAYARSLLTKEDIQNLKERNQLQELKLQIII
ncbi:hypothetical protein C0585_03165 [Candidatus Woesearchaeota archaeon]|nr:MAG: hypothetical protein C0585_03165 [Candidatus Woesearchaeota archaeon]